MKVQLPRPPVLTNGGDEELRRLSGWLSALSDTLNAAFCSIGEENMNNTVKEKLNERSGKN